MENEYYTPDIEDLRIGYECEVCDLPHVKEFVYMFPRNFEYKKIKIEDISMIQVAANHLKQFCLRTKYLTKENIELLGWKINIDYNHLSRCGFEKDNYYLLLNMHNKIPFIKIIYKDPSKEEDGWIVAPEHFQISIQCPSINELKTILKLLSI